MRTLDVIGVPGGKATTEVVKPPINREIREGDLRSIPVKPRVEVGDRLRFSVALLKQMLDQADPASEIVTLVDVITEADGAKILVLKRS